MMLDQELQAYITDVFEDAINNPRRNIYFDRYYSFKRLNQNRVELILEDIVDEEFNLKEPPEGRSLIFSINDEPIIFHQLESDSWLVVYSSALRQRDTKDISDLASTRGWIIDAWIPSEVIRGIYEELTPGHENVNIHRKWDPYWIYQREGEVPEELADFYDRNIDDFVQKEIEFSLKTPRRLVDDALKMGATEELLQRSEISMSRFKIQKPNQDTVQSDGGVLSESGGDQADMSGVTIRESAKVAHRTGEMDATFYLLDEIDRRVDYEKQLEGILGSREYEENEDGSLELVSYEAPKILEVLFTDFESIGEASIKLSNFFTVGQDDVKIHGILKERAEIEFITESYTVFDKGEYDVFFTEKGEGPAIYIRPTSGSVPGLTYILQKLKEKIDPRVETDIRTEPPSLAEL